MKNRKLKNYLKLGILFFGISALLWNCEKEKNTHNHQEHQIAKIKYLDINEIPEVQSAISELNNFGSKQNKSTFSKSMQTDFGSLNLTNILEYANNDGKLTYSFLIDKEISLETPYTFENLHLVKLEEGYLAYILKWEPNQDWFENNDYNFLLQYFTGKRTHYDLDYNIIQQTDFINGEPINITSNKSKASKNEHKSMDMEIICVDIIYNLCTDTGKLYCGGSICGFGSQTYCSITYSGGGGTGGDGSGTRIPRNTNSDSDVVDGGDAIVVPIPSWDSSKFIIDLYNITDNEVIGILNFNSNFTDDLYSYLKKEYFSDEAKSFGEQSIKGFLNTAEIDWEEQVILDTTFVNNERLKCVYDKFKSGNNTISNYLENFLPDDAVGHLNFKADPNFAINHPNLTTAGAITSPPINGALNSNVANFNIDIIFNTDPNLLDSSEPNNPTIILAVELIHEMVHAEMYRKLLECAKLPHVNYSQMTKVQYRDFIYKLKNNFNGLYDYFVRYKFYKEDGVFNTYTRGNNRTTSADGSTL